MSTVAPKAMPRVRLRASRTAPAKVDETGGRFGAGIIRGVSVCTKGEALGHGLWLDESFLDSLGSHANGERGIKARFTHPGMCSDGLGKSLGRIHVTGREGDKVLGDLHLSKSSRSAPEGDLGGYVMQLAKEDPEAFGTSIVFSRDLSAEEDYALANVNDEGDFQTRDPDNVRNLPHARLKKLHAVDCVDDPAANPDGLFSALSSEPLGRIESAIGWVLGLSEAQPPHELFGDFDADSARAFVGNFLATRGLSIAGTAPLPFTKETRTMSAMTEQASSAQAPERKVATLADLKAFSANDPAFIVEAMEAGLTAEEARESFYERRIAVLELELAKSNEERAALLDQVESLTARKPAGAPALAFSGTDSTKPQDFMQLAADLRDETHPELSAAQRRMGFGMGDAIKRATNLYPESYAAYRAAQNLKG